MIKKSFGFSLLMVFGYILFADAMLIAKQQAESDTKPMQTPDVTIVFVVDQFAYHYLEKLRPHFKGGLRTLLKHGICYESAYHPHGLPCTATGHAGLSSGCCARDHGIVDNEMPDEKTGVISPSDEGADKVKSSKLFMVDNLTDQFMISAPFDKKHHAFSLSLKSRSAVMMGGKKGKVIWFDSKNGQFDSSKAYYDTLPEWLCKFNAHNRISPNRPIVWQTRFPANSASYNFEEIDNYDFAVIPKLVNSSITLDLAHKAPYEIFLKTPHAQKKLLDLTKACIDAHYVNKQQDRLLLWVSLSSLDLAGHMFGPDSRECIDMLYHLDAQLEAFFKQVASKVAKNKTLYVLTGDHGIMPIPEILQKKGLSSAQRILSKDVIGRMNQALQQTYGIEGLVEQYEPPYFFMNKAKLNAIDAEGQLRALQFLKNFLKKQPGFRDVWLTQDLVAGCFNKKSLEYNFKQQIYPGRCGDLLCLMHPYVMLTNYGKGTSHATPYGYDTQVPLMLFQASYLEKKQIYDNVAIQQLPVTLAYLLGTAKPSASAFKVLPGIFKSEK